MSAGKDELLDDLHATHASLATCAEDIEACALAALRRDGDEPKAGERAASDELIASLFAEQARLLSKLGELVGRYAVEVAKEEWDKSIFVVLRYAVNYISSRGAAQLALVPEIIAVADQFR